MTRHAAVSLLMALFVVLMADTVQSAVQLYSGRMEILVTSGKGCAGMSPTHDVSLALTEEAGGRAALHGYFLGGGGITIGMFSGSDPAHLEVYYPYPDEMRATGHFLSLVRSDSTLTAELHDRHIDPSADDCNFDLARMELTPTVDGDAAARLTQMAGLFDAQMLSSQAVSLARSSGYGAALPYFEKALVLADRFLPPDSDQINTYITGLATSFIWLDRFDDFNHLFDTRINTIKDESVRSVFSEYRVRSLMDAGRDALGREEYETALANFEQSYKLQPQNREAIAAVMAVYVRSGRYTEAYSFLERAEAMLENEVDRKDIRAAAAMVLSIKAQQDDKAGKGADAEIALKRAMELDAGSANYLIALARLRHKAGSLPDAEKLLKQGLERFTDLQSQEDIIAARDKMRQNELFLKKLRKVGS